MGNDQTLWQDQDETSSRGIVAMSWGNDRGVHNARTLTLNTDAMKTLLVPAVDDTSIKLQTALLTTIELPLPDGSNVSLSIESTQILPTVLAKKFTSIRTYKVAKPNGNIVSGRIDFTELGFHAMLQTADGHTLLIDPASKKTNTEYLSYRKSEQSNQEAFQCSAFEDDDHADHAFSPLQSRAATQTRSNEGIIEYRIAIAATAEYTQLQGGTIASSLSAIATTLNRVNHVYEQNLGIRLSLVEKNDLLIYTKSATDPYSNYNIETMLLQNQSNLDLVIGGDNYDIGHVFGTSGGGLAYIGSVCNDSSKARGASGIRNPNNDSFDIDYVAHEIGHQFGATHTFNSNQGICTSGARTARSAFEPGSGSSIMSYVGGCGTDDLQSFADAMFHSGNIEQINENVLNGTGSSCGIVHQTTNSPPIAFAGSSYTIPALTPFELNGQAVDYDDDTLLFSWEQIDTGSASALKTDTGNNPLFRIMAPTSESNRSFPVLMTLLGTGYTKGETLPSTNRIMNFQLAVYDGHHAPSLDRVSLNIVNSGEAFKLKAPASQYGQGTAVIYWNTANTQNSPVSCPSIDLHLSTDGGLHFDTLLASAIPNTGAASVYLPNTIQTTTGRFKLSCSNNIFFSVSSDNFAISQNIESSAAGPRNIDTIIIADNTTYSGGGSTGTSLFLLFLIATMFKKDQKLN